MATDAQPRRFRFRVRTLLLVIAVLALVLVVVIQQVQIERMRRSIEAAAIERNTLTTMARELRDALERRKERDQSNKLPSVR
jgi:cell division septal protein FtsQ